MDSVRFGWEKLADLLAELDVREMILAQYDELAPHPEAAPLDVDWDAKLRLEEEGKYRIWVARADGMLAGFISWHVTPHINHRRTLVAFDDVHYLAPAFRDNTRVGWRMWRTVEPALKELGVKIVFPHDNHSRHLTPFFLALGFRPSMTIYSKVIG